VVVVRRGWLVGGLFAVIEVEGPCQRPVSDLARKWHGGANDDESWRSGPTFMALLTHPWVGSAREDGSVAGEAEHGECDEGVG
jgi:hypothetical protein